MTNTGNGQYTIMEVQSGKPLEVYGGLTAAGDKVDLWSYSGGTGQQWTFQVP